MARHFLRDDDLSASERLTVLDLASRMKTDRFSFRPLEGPRAVALLFDKPSTRTRVSFSVGVQELGGYSIVLDRSTTQLGRGEPIADTARVLERQVAAIAWRTFEQSDLDEMASVSSVPVINTLSNSFHPCQVLADFLTIQEWQGPLAGRRLTYLGDAGNNMAHSYALAGADAGMHVRLAAPPDFQPDPEVLAWAQQLARRSGGSVEVFAEVSPAVVGADVLATDTWSSMGATPLGGGDITRLRPFALTSDVMDAAAPGAMALHCLPAHRGEEIAEEVIDGPRSAAWDQAENRLHVQKALLAFLLTPDEVHVSDDSSGVRVSGT